MGRDASDSVPVRKRRAAKLRGNRRKDCAGPSNDSPGDVLDRRSLCVFLARTLPQRWLTQLRRTDTFCAT